MNKHRMWTHRARGGIYEVLGMGMYKSMDVASDMSKLVVVKTGTGWCDWDVFFPGELPEAEVRAGGEARAQCETNQMFKRSDEVVIYRGSDAKIWVRPAKDFYDGRFQRLNDNLEPIADEIKLVIPSGRLKGEPSGHIDPPNPVPRKAG